MESNAASHTNHDRAAFSQSGLRPPRHLRWRLSTQYVTLITHPSPSGGAKTHSLRREEPEDGEARSPPATHRLINRHVTRGDICLSMEELDGSNAMPTIPMVSMLERDEKTIQNDERWCRMRLQLTEINVDMKIASHGPS